LLNVDKRLRPASAKRVTKEETDGLGRDYKEGGVIKCSPGDFESMRVYGSLESVFLTCSLGNPNV
jgi:hypothetical protein